MDELIAIPTFERPLPDVGLPIAIELDDKTTYDLVCSIRSTCRVTLDEIANLYKPVTEFFHERHKTALAAKKDAETPWTLLSARCGTLIMEHDRHLAERKALEERKAREEQIRREQAAEAERLAKAGRTEEGVAVLDRPISVETPEPKLASARPAGSMHGYRTDYVATITDATKVPREWCVPDEAAIRAFVRATKGATPIPGVEIRIEQKLVGG